MPRSRTTGRTSPLGAVRVLFSERHAGQALGAFRAALALACVAGPALAGTPSFWPSSFGPAAGASSGRHTTAWAPARQALAAAASRITAAALPLQRLFEQALQVQPTLVQASQRPAAALQGLAPAGVEDPLLALTRLGPAGLAERLPELLEDRPTLALNALLWRAGASVPSGLTAARTARREEQRTAFLELVRAELDASPSSRARVLVHLTELVRSSRSAVALRCAGLRCASELGLYELTWLLEAALTDGEEQVRFVASQALARLYGRRFATPERWSEFLGEVPRALAPVLAAQLRSVEEERRALYTELLEGAPARAIGILEAGEPDPLVRRAAARQLKAAVIAQELDLVQAFEALLYAARRELDEPTFAALLQSAVDLALIGDGDEADPQALVQLATVLVDEGRSELFGPALRVMPRLAGAGSKEGGSALLQATRLLTGVLGAAPVRDGDRCERALQDWKLAVEAAPGPLSDGLAATVGRQVLPLLALGEADGGLARSAAAVAPLVLRGQELLEFLSAPDASPQLLAELCGVVPSALAAAEEGAVAELLASIQRLAAHEDALVRRAALAALLDESAAATLARFQAEPAVVLDAALVRLAVEEDEQARAALLELLGRLPSTEHLGRLTQDPALASLRDPARVPVAALEASLRGLAGEDARALLTAAEWVAAGGELQAATQLLAALPEAELTALTEADHARALTLAHSLRRQRGRGALDGALRSRLLQVHEPGAGAAWETGLVGSHLHALLLGGEITDATAPRPDPDGALAAEVLAAFERAGALAGAGSEPSLAELERDRFRFLDRIGRPGPAAAALVALVDRLGADQGPLTSEDLREGAKRVAQHLPDAEEGARAARAFSLLERVVRAAAWNDLPAERRLKDLEHWAAYAQRSGAAKTREAVRAFVGELPALAEEAAYGDDPLPGLDGHPLAALCATRAQHERLLAALTTVASAPAESSAAPEAVESATEPAPEADPETVPPAPEGDPPPAPEDGDGAPEESDEGGGFLP